MTSKKQLKEFSTGGKLDRACKRPALLNHPNKHLTTVFEELLKHQEANLDAPSYAAKCLAYERALSVLRSWPSKICQVQRQGFEKRSHVWRKFLQEMCRNFGNRNM